MTTNTLTRKQKETQSLESLTDSELYQKCKKYGLQARLWRRKFAGLLPEVAKRELYKKKGYTSIYEFAGKLAGMSHDSVYKILRLAIKLDDKPVLKNMLEKGEQGWGKIENVANQGYKEYVKDHFTKLSVLLSEDVEFELRLLKRDIEKEKSQMLSWDEFFEEVVKKCKKKKVERKKRQKNEKKVKSEGGGAKKTESGNRYIPQDVKNEVLEKTNQRCAFPNCKTPPKIFHHTERFAINSDHDPEKIVPLCKKHERAVHSSLIKNENDDPESWIIRNLREIIEDSKTSRIDKKVNEHRKE